jgi:predicted transcriptional regulator
LESYKGYIEDGQLDYAVEEIKDLKPEQAALFTPKRIQLLYQLAIMRVESINDLTKKTRRNVKNVYQDLQLLSRFDFVKLIKRKRRDLIPETLIKEIMVLAR